MGLAFNVENCEHIYDANDVDKKVEGFHKVIGSILDTYTPW